MDGFLKVIYINFSESLRIKDFKVDESFPKVQLKEVCKWGAGIAEVIRTNKGRVLFMHLDERKDKTNTLIDLETGSIVAKDTNETDTNYHLKSDTFSYPNPENPDQLVVLEIHQNGREYILEPEHAKRFKAFVKTHLSRSHFDIESKTLWCNNTNNH
jgi:hypothetical protein